MNLQVPTGNLWDEFFFVLHNLFINIQDDKNKH